MIAYTEVTGLLIALLLFGYDVDRLGSEVFDERCAAEERLRDHRWLAHPLLRVQYKDLERRKRVERARRCEYKPLPLLVRRRVWTEWHSGSKVQSSYERKVDGYTAVWYCIGVQGWYIERLYCERARTQLEWRGWCTVHDARRATELLADDLVTLGIPAPLVHLALEEPP